MLNIYLYTARWLLVCGYRDQSLHFLALALGECNRNALLKIERGHVLRALSHARRVQA